LQGKAKISPIGKLVGPFFEGILCNFFVGETMPKKAERAVPKGMSTVILFLPYKNNFTETIEL